MNINININFNAVIYPPSILNILIHKFKLMMTKGLGLGLGLNVSSFQGILSSLVGSSR